MNALTPGLRTFAKLKTFARQAGAAEQCSACGCALPPDHDHAFEVATQKISCLCASCHSALTRNERKYRAIPEGVHRVNDVSWATKTWEHLGLPIHIVFIVRRETTYRAFFPSPAGQVETQLGTHNWADLSARNPDALTLKPDVEALLLSRLSGQSLCLKVPIDVCFALTGLLRRHWKGMHGGAQVWREISQFLNHLVERAQ